MEDGFLIIRDVEIENANAIAGVTWGVPGITNFLGATHALSRKLSLEEELELTGCGVICHKHRVQAYRQQGWGDFYFGLTRNPLTSKGESSSFVEEGRMHMTVSLIISIDGDLDEIDDKEAVCQRIKQLFLSQRLAGGTVVGIGAVVLEEPPEDEGGYEKYSRRWLGQMLPGFALVQRSGLLAEHVARCRELTPGAEPLDAWLDFSSLKYKAERTGDAEEEENQESTWQRVPRPGEGWLVPIPIGYRGISELYEAGKVARTRDNTTPFRFVESVYTVGEWVSPHRLKRLDQLLWRYKTEPDSGWYLCENNYKPTEVENV